MSVIKYSTSRVVLHWLSAVVIIWASISGFAAAFLALPVGWAEAISFFNVSLTTVFIPFFIVRVYCLITQGMLPDVAVLSLKQRLGKLCANLMFMAFYFNILIVLLTGVLMMEKEINVFHVLTLPQPLSDPALHVFFHAVHRYSCASLAALVVLHVLAVLVHHMQGDKALKRMRL